MRLILTLLAALALAAPAAARPLDPAEAASLGKALAAFDTALTGRNSAALVAAIPPRLVAAIAAQSGMDVATLTSTMVTQSDAMLADTTFQDLSTDVKSADAQEAALPDGTSIVWAIVPVSFVMDRNGKRTAFRQSILALNDAGAWYLLRIEHPAQRDLAATVYPFLAGITIPPGEAKPLN